MSRKTEDWRGSKGPAEPLGLTIEDLETNGSTRLTLTVKDLQRANEELKACKNPTRWFRVDWLDELKGLYQDIAAVRDRTEVIMGELDADDKDRLKWALYELNEAAAAARGAVAYMEARAKA